MALSEPEFANTAPPSIAQAGHSLIDSLRRWLANFFGLVALDGQKAGAGLKLVLVFGIGAAVLLLTGWLALVGCAVAVLVESDILGWVWSLLVAALLSFAGASGLVVIAIRRSKDLLFHATRRQLGLISAFPPEPAPDHE